MHFSHNSRASFDHLKQFVKRVSFLKNDIDTCVSNVMSMINPSVLEEFSNNKTLSKMISETNISSQSKDTTISNIITYFKEKQIDKTLLFIDRTLHSIHKSHFKKITHYAIYICHDTYTKHAANVYFVDHGNTLLNELKITLLNRVALFINTIGSSTFVRMPDGTEMQKYHYHSIDDTTHLDIICYMTDEIRFVPLNTSFKQATKIRCFNTASSVCSQKHIGANRFISVTKINGMLSVLTHELIHAYHIDHCLFDSEKYYISQNKDRVLYVNKFNSLNEAMCQALTTYMHVIMTSYDFIKTQKKQTMKNFERVVEKLLMAEYYYTFVQCARFLQIGNIPYLSNNVLNDMYNAFKDAPVTNMYIFGRLGIMMSINKSCMTFKNFLMCNKIFKSDFGQQCIGSYEKYAKNKPSIIIYDIILDYLVSTKDVFNTILKNKETPNNAKIIMEYTAIDYKCDTKNI